MCIQNTPNTSPIVHLSPSRFETSKPYQTIGFRTTRAKCGTVGVASSGLEFATQRWQRCARAGEGRCRLAKVTNMVVRGLSWGWMGWMSWYRVGRWAAGHLVYCLPVSGRWQLQSACIWMSRTCS